MSVLSAGDLYDLENERARATWGQKPPTPAEQLAAQEQRIAALRRQRMIETHGDPAEIAAREFRSEQIGREIEEQSRIDKANEARARIRKNLALADEVVAMFKRNVDEEEIARELKLAPASVMRILENATSWFDE